MILEIWPNAFVVVYGSTFTGLYLSNSDIDIKVQGVLDPTPLKTLQMKLLASNHPEPNTVVLVDRVLFPLVRFIDRESKLQIDIACSEESVPISSNVISKYIQKYPLLPKLFLVLKQFLKQQDLNTLYTGM